MTRPAVNRALTVVVCLVPLLLFSACARATMSAPAVPPTAEQLRELWIEPTDIASRDLFGGPGGAHQAPDPQATHKVVAVDATGYSAGYDVIDPQGREWRMKLGDEAQSEVVVSRLLWAIGFHQPPTYFVPSVKLEGGRPDDAGRSARFRLEEGYKTEGQWAWHTNPYVGTRQLKGLLVANLLVNNWDFKTSQNRIYVLEDAAAEPRRRYAVQDLGAALGATRWPIGNRNNVASFEKQQLIKRVENGIVKFDYHARHTELLADITPADVVWTSQLFARLSDEQLHDAFRAANYAATTRTRFVTKLKSKIQEGLALDSRPARLP